MNNMSYMLIDLKKKKNHTLMFEVIKSICTFESINRFIYENIHIDP